MTDLISPELPPHTTADSLRCLTRFLREIGDITKVPTLAERILTTLLEHTRCPWGSFYLSEQGRSDVYRLAAHNSHPSESNPSTLSLTHPLVQSLFERQVILDHSVYHGLDEEHIHDDVPSAQHIRCSLAIPLLNRGRLLAFALLRSESRTDSADAWSMEFLMAIAQSAANSLDSLLAHEDLRQSQAVMRRTDRLRSLEIMAGGFAHEIRNPLTSIKTFIQLTPERKDDAEFIREFGHVVLDDVHRIERLIQEILDYTRYMEPQTTEEDVNGIVSSCLYFIDVTARSRGIKIEKHLSSDIPRVMLDQQQIKQVLLNMFLNAIDAMGEHGGTLRVGTGVAMTPEGIASVQIDIEDTGRGISAENLEHIFDPFFTTKHESAEYEGTGLGLSIAHQIIREHRGTIHVRSTEGVGTAFRINLPSLA